MKEPYLTEEEYKNKKHEEDILYENTNNPLLENNQTIILRKTKLGLLTVDPIFCKLQHKQIAITHIDGSTGGMTKPCCSFKNYYHNNGIDINLHAVKWDFMTIYNFNSFNEIMESNPWNRLIKNGPIRNCDFCISKELTTKKSLRTYWNNKITDDVKQLEMMHISVDSICNMSCLTCSPAQSSTWNKKSNLRQLFKFSQSFRPNNRVTEYVKNFKRISLNTDFSKLKILKISGGEPFYSENFTWFINLLNEKTDLSNIEIWINTNASNIPKPEVWEILKKFKSVKLDMSIDAIGDYHEYVRYGSKWKDILNFINFVNENKNDKIFLGVSSTISLLNFNVFNEIKSYCKENNLDFTHSILQGPEWLSIYTIPVEYRKEYIEKVKLSSSKLHYAMNSDRHFNTNGKVKEYLKLMEKENNNKLEDYNPELKQIIEQFNI